jgi:hypothetical protein
MTKEGAQKAYSISPGKKPLLPASFDGFTGGKIEVKFRDR